MSTRNVIRFFVGNVPWTVGSRELKQYFSEFGYVVSANVVFDRNTGLSKGYGFVQYVNEDAVHTIKNKKSHTLEGNELNIQEST